MLLICTVLLLPDTVHSALLMLVLMVQMSHMLEYGSHLLDIHYRESPGRLLELDGFVQVKCGQYCCSWSLQFTSSISPMDKLVISSQADNF